MEGYIAIVAIVSFFLGFYLLFYILYKKKHKSFRAKFQNKNIIYYEKIKTNIEISGFHTTVNTADVIINDNSIFLLLYSVIKNPGIIIEFSEEKPTIFYPEVSRFFIIKSMHRVHGKLRIIGEFRTSFGTRSYKLFLDFNNRNFDWEKFNL